MLEDNERTQSPEEMLRVIQDQQLATVRHLYLDPVLLYVPWGVAWVLGFTAFFLHYGLDGRPYAPISPEQALSVLMIAQFAAGALYAYGVVRMNRQVRGDSRVKGAMYGYAWFAGITLVSIIGLRLTPLLPPDEGGLLWAAGMLTIVAILHMVGGAVWLNWPMFFVGVWVAAVNGVGVLLGAGWHALLTAVLLGGGFIAVGVWMRWRS